MTALVALIFMAAQGSGSAALDGPHDPPVNAGQPVGLSISRAVLTEDIRHLQPTRGWHPQGYERDGAILSRGEVTWARLSRLTCR